MKSFLIITLAIFIFTSFSEGWLVGEETFLSIKDFYNVLGVNKTSSTKDIKKAFRQLAKKYHPDKNDEEGAEVVFYMVTEAYEILSDEEKRQDYNTHLVEHDERVKMEFDRQETARNYHNHHHHHHQNNYNNNNYNQRHYHSYSTNTKYTKNSDFQAKSFY